VRASPRPRLHYAHTGSTCQTWSFIDRATTSESEVKAEAGQIASRTPNRISRKPLLSASSVLRAVDAGLRHWQANDGTTRNERSISKGSLRCGAFDSSPAPRSPASFDVLNVFVNSLSSACVAATSASGFAGIAALLPSLTEGPFRRLCSCETSSTAPRLHPTMTPTRSNGKPPMCEDHFSYRVTSARVSGPGATPRRVSTVRETRSHTVTTHLASASRNLVLSLDGACLLDVPMT
jgi:hypothetical protein